MLGTMVFALLVGGHALYRHTLPALVEGKAVSCAAQEPRPHRILGKSEVVHLGEHRELIFDAKVDSGAHTSSIHATELETFTREGALFVRFKTLDHQGRERVLERLVSQVRQVRSASGISQRYYFREIVWIDDVSYDVEVNLADRSQLSKKMLIGKNLLERGYLVDTSKSYVATEAASLR